MPQSSVYALTSHRGEARLQAQAILRGICNQKKGAMEHGFVWVFGLSPISIRHWAISRKDAGLILDGVIAIFHWHNPSGRTMAPGSTQPQTEMSARDISWGVKAAGALGWQPHHLHVPTVMQSGSLDVLEPTGFVHGLFYLYLSTSFHQHSPLMHPSPTLYNLTNW